MVNTKIHISGIKMQGRNNQLFCILGLLCIHGLCVVYLMWCCIKDMEFTGVTTVRNSFLCMLLAGRGQKEQWANSKSCSNNGSTCAQDYSVVLRVPALVLYLFNEEVEKVIEISCWNAQPWYWEHVSSGIYIFNVLISSIQQGHPGPQSCLMSKITTSWLSVTPHPIIPAVNIYNCVFLPLHFPVELSKQFLRSWSSSLMY